MEKVQEDAITLLTALVIVLGGRAWQSGAFTQFLTDFIVTTVVCLVVLWFIRRP